MNAYNYPSPLFETHTVEENWENGKRTVKGKTKLVKSETIKKKAQRIVKEIGASSSIVQNKKLFIQIENTEYNLELTYFGIPEDTPEGTGINLIPEETEKCQYRNLNFRKLNFEKIFYSPEWWGNGQFILKGEKPKNNEGYDEQEIDMDFLVKNLPMTDHLSWDNIVRLGEEVGDDLLKFAENIYLRTKFVQFIEKNTTGTLTFKIKYDKIGNNDWRSPVYVYSDGSIVALIMCYQASDIKIDNIGILNYKPSRKF